MRPRLLDLFCGGGGAAMGYHRVGFEVVGVDIAPQPNYPFEFHQADALEFPLDGFDGYHASPPCQFKTAYGRRPGHVHPSGNRIPQTRARLRGLPYVIENVVFAHADLVNPIMLCGSSFGLDVRRHRLFECSFPALALPCDHSWQTPRFPQATNRTKLRRTVEVGVWRIPLKVQQRAMGVDWLPLEELSEAIPPAYTEYIGGYLVSDIDARGCRMTEALVYAHGDEKCYCCGRPRKNAGMDRPLILTDKGWVCATDDFCRAGTSAVKMHTPNPRRAS